MYLKKLWVKNSQTWGSKQISRSRKYRDYIQRHSIIKVTRIKDNKRMQKTIREGFPGGPVKNPPCNASDTSSIPGAGRSHMPQSN